MALFDEMGVQYPDADISICLDQAFATSREAVGQLADYRKELSIAVSRAIYPSRLDLNVEYSVFPLSLIDSFAYATVRYKTLLEQGIVTDEVLDTWWLTLSMISCMYRDSFKADKVYRVFNSSLSEEDDDCDLYFNSLLEEAFDAILDVDHLTVDQVIDTGSLQSEEDYATIGKSLLEDINGPGSNLKDTNKQELKQ
jgi:hypothetical protein